MAAFTPNFTMEQSDDCKTLIFTDDSNFSDNTEGYNYAYFTTKSITLYDSEGEVLGSPIVIVDDTPVNFELDKDRYLSAIYTLQHNTDTPLTVTKDFATYCNVELAYGNIVAEEDCNCNSDNLAKIDKILRAVDIFAKRSNGVKAQDEIDLANETIKCDYPKNYNCGC